jgi:hypothetical protein
VTQEEINDMATARCSAVAYMREQGMTYNGIGKRFGVSTTRVQQMYEKHMRDTERLYRKTKNLIEAIKQIT